MLLRRGAVEFIRTSRPARTCRANVRQHRGVHRHTQHEPVGTSDLVSSRVLGADQENRSRPLAAPRTALPQLAPERAMRLVLNLLNFKRQRRHHDLVERRKDLCELSPNFMRCTCASANDASARTGKTSRPFRPRPHTRPSACPESCPPAQQARPLIAREKSQYLPGCA